MLRNITKQLLINNSTHNVTLVSKELMYLESNLATENQLIIQEHTNNNLQLQLGYNIIGENRYI
jgi:hypothetical protein